MNHGHPIRIAAKRTGMSPHLIRMWERRYAAVEPRRTETGRRLYSDDDIQRLILLRQATMEGESIGQIAGLTEDQLRELILDKTTESTDDEPHAITGSVENFLNRCLQSIKNLDAVQLEMGLLRASVNLGQNVFLEKLLHPLLEITGDMWSEGHLNVSHEHFASAVVRSLLGSMHLSSTTDGHDPLIIGTTPSGQLHEFGSLIALVTASSGGWRTLYLGPNMPAEDIAHAIADRNASALALSIVYQADDSQLADQLRRIRQMAPNRIPILVGGRSAIAYEKVLDEIGAIRIGGLTHLRRELDRLRNIHGSSPKLGSQ
jgi:MerR family transcriptional regulator, light-induced transcriptional regulator